MTETLAASRAALAQRPDLAAFMDTCGEALVRSGQVDEGMVLLERVGFRSVATCCASEACCSVVGIVAVARVAALRLPPAKPLLCPSVIRSSRLTRAMPTMLATEGARVRSGISGPDELARRILDTPRR